MSSLFPDYREKYRDCVRKKYQTSEYGSTCHRPHVHLNERHAQLIVASEKEGEHGVLNWSWRHAGTIPEQAAAITVDALFGAENDKPQTVVIVGAAGVGKTTTARQVMLGWATGRLFPERFDAAFYISCRQANLVRGPVSLADLILKNHPELTPKEAVKELLRIPGKLLFIIDGFDELNCSIEQWEDNLSIDPCERKSVGVLLGCLLHKTVLPEACLIITTRPNALRSLENCLQSPCYVGLLGFSEKGKEEYFQKFFGDKEVATEALNYVKGNETLFATSSVPGVCWLICTVMKEQLDRSKEDLVQMDEKLTAVYALYLSHLMESPCCSSEQHNLRGLCSWAADGICRKKVLFTEEEILELGQGQADSLPSALCETLFHKDPGCDGIYSFIHLSVQEFLAALFYVFEDVTKDTEAFKQDIIMLLESSSKDRRDVTLIAQFIFGLLNSKITKYIKEQFGWKMSPTAKTDLLEWLRLGYTQINTEYPDYDQLDYFHSLYEIAEEDFVQNALDHLTELTMDRLKFTPMDQVVLSFCVNNSLNLEALSLYTCLFLSGGQEAEVCLGLPSQLCQQYQKTQKHSPIYLLCQALKDPRSKIKKLELDGCKLTDGCSADLSTVLSINRMLVELSLRMTTLKDSGVQLVCEGLIDPHCKLERLGLLDCDLTRACCRDLSAVLSTSQTLTELKLGYNPALGDGGVQLLCEGLKHPNCKLQSLGLEECELTAASCQELASVLSTSQTLVKLNLEHNKLGDAGVKLLCAGLKHPDCKLQTLSLATCELTPASCENLALVFHVNQTLTELAVEYNRLEDSGMRLLCEGLKQPNCKLQILGLGQCNLTSACCEALSSVLTISQTLRELDVEYNALGDSGVKLLCDGLRHPHCKLQKLNLYNCDFTAACGADLASVLSSKEMLSELLLGSNKLGDTGMKLLCEGLRHPKCKLQKLCLCGSEITAAACEELSSVLSSSQMLEDIDLWDNTLGDSGVRLLCEGLKHPDCKLQVLSMWNCKLTAASCGDLSSALSTSQSLKELRLGGNELGDAGVRLLCKGLKHPNCRLKKIGLDIDKLTEETVKELGFLKKIKPDLIIDA